MGIDVFSITIGIVAQGALALETEFLVEPDCREIVREDVELDAADIVPVIRCVDQRPKKVRPHPFSREIVVNADRQVGDMGLSSCPAKQPAIGDWCAGTRLSVSMVRLWLA